MLFVFINKEKKVFWLLKLKNEPKIHQKD